MPKVGEGKAVRIEESLLAQIWRRQLIKKEALLTAGGQRVEVLYPGRESRDSGPDFCDALIAIEGKLLRGDVELHVTPQEWQAHRHHKDPGYNGVILHVVLWGGQEDSLLHSGERVPILALSPYLAGSLEELRRTVQLSLSPEEPCHKALQRHGPAAVADLLDKAGEERFYAKVERFRTKLATGEAGQVLYEGLMRALGYAKNKKPFEELARLLPLRVFRGLATPGDTGQIQGLMLGTAGLLPGQRGKRNRDADEWGARLEQIWGSFGMRERMKGWDWRFFRVRPENFPPRRIAAASYLLSRYGGGFLGEMLRLLSQTPLSKVQKELERSLIVQVDGYWASHFDFGIEARWNSSLLGRGRVREIVVNILLPFFFAWAEKFSQPWLGERAMELYRNHPQLGENWVTRYMEERIFGEHQAKVNSACRQQGLVHLYQTFCVQRRCPECPLG
jgi:hypothetical protein